MYNENTIQNQIEKADSLERWTLIEDLCRTEKRKYRHIIQLYEISEKSLTIGIY